MADMSVLLLLFLMKAAVTTSSVYVVTDRFSFGGVYEEKREPELHYTRLGEADFDGDYTFLYRQPPPSNMDPWRRKEFVHC